MKPVVSVCVPAFEQPRPLRKALESVLAQDFKSFEIIVTDDSRDGSVGELVKTFLHDARVTYVKNATTKGTPGNWNEAVGLARGDLVKILHHDDWLTGSDSLGRFVQLLNDNPGCDLAFSATSVCDPAGALKRTHRATENDVRKIMSAPASLLWANLIGGPSSVIFRRPAFTPFDVSLQWLVDVAFYHTILSRNNQIAFCPDPLVATTDGSPKQVTYSSATKEVRIREWLLLYKQWKPERKPGDLKWFLELLRGADPAIITSILGPEQREFPIELRFGIRYNAVRFMVRSWRRRLRYGKSQRPL